MASTEPATVVGLVTALVKTYETATYNYTCWKRNRAQKNHYRRQAGKSTLAVSNCALSTSLGISAHTIKETYDIAHAIAGNEFSTGDAGCREKLWAQLQTLDEGAAGLERATSSPGSPLELAELLQTSESVRMSCTQALAELYARIAAGRPIPKELPVPKHRSRQDGRLCRDSGPARHGPDDNDDFDKMTTAMTINSGPLRFQSEPPSPPPTPKPAADDAESTWNGSEAGPGGGAGGAVLRPKNSVFSVFCPEAMTLQVDVKKSIPAAKKCKCGYRWRQALPDKKDTILLKEGFRMSMRFLAKSHRDKDAYGCVLCTSSGRTEMYESAEHLRVHMNASHTKWQMLHDRDMA